MIRINNYLFLIIISYCILTIFLSWPLIFHLDGFLLTESFENITHADTEHMINHIIEGRKLLLKHEDFIIVKPGFAVPQSYIYLGIFSTILGLNEIVFHNAFFLLSVFLSGLFMYFFMLELSKDRVASFFAGFLYMSSNYVLHQYVWGHANQWQIQWIPLIFLFLEKTLIYKKVRYAAFLGLALGLQILSSGQYSVYLSFIVPVYLLLRICLIDKKIFIQKRFWLNMLISIVTALVFSSFYLIKRIGLSSPIRSIETNLSSYWILHSFKQLFDVNSNISLGTIQILLVLCGIFIICINIKDKDYKKYIPFVILLVFLILCMTGPWSNFAPYYWLYKVWPFIKNFRVPRRIFPFVMMCSSVLSSLVLLNIKKRALYNIWNLYLLKYRIHILAIIIVAIIVSHILASKWLWNHHIYYP